MGETKKTYCIGIGHAWLEKAYLSVGAVMLTLKDTDRMVLPSENDAQVICLALRNCFGLEGVVYQLESTVRIVGPILEAAVQSTIQG